MRRSAGDVNMINIGLIPGDVCHMKSAGFFYFFHEIKLLATFRQTGEDEKEGVLQFIRNLGPHWSNGNVFSMYQLRARAGAIVDQVSGLPDPYQHVFPFIAKVTMDIYKGIIKGGRIDMGECLYVDFRFGNRRKLAFFTDGARIRKSQVHRDGIYISNLPRILKKSYGRNFAVDKKCSDC